MTGGKAAPQEFVPLQGRKPEPPVSPLHQYPFNNKKPERIVQALLFAHRESGEKEFNKANALRARKELRGRESLSGENLSFLFQTARADRPFPFLPLPLQRLLTDGEAARQEFVPLQGRKTKPPVSPLHQCPFNNKEPERIVQALLFFHRESDHLPLARISLPNTSFCPQGKRTRGIR